MEVETARKINENKEARIIEQQKVIIAATFGLIISDLMFLSKQHDLLEAIEGLSGERELMLEDYITLTRSKGIYDQIRFIDISGNEIMRVNYNDGKPYIIPDKELQSKSERYYFKEIIQVNAGEVYISVFDLNVENGKIERPYKPVIRFGTPVFDDAGEKRGVLILNYLGLNLIDSLGLVSANTVRNSILLNSDGFWLSGIEPEDEWGFMIDERSERKFSNTFPDAWKNISSSELGQFYDETGMFTYATIYPRLAGEKFSGSIYSLFAHSPMLSSKPYDYAYSWKIVSYIPPHILDASLAGLRRSYFLVYTLLLVLAGTVSWFFSLASVRRTQAEDELKDSEEKFRSIAELAEDAIILSDINGDIISWNNGARKMFGYNMEEVRNRSLTMIIPRRYRGNVLKRINQLKNTDMANIPESNFEYYCLRKEGREFPVELSISGWNTRKGRFYSGIIRDITKRKQVEDELLGARDRAEAANRAKSNFLDNMSHEIRTPMNAILGYAQILLRDKKLNSYQLESVERIEISGKHLLVLINDILDLSKIEAGHMDLKLADFDLNDTIKSVSTMFRFRCEQKKLVWQVLHPWEGRNHVHGDEGKLRQVLINLLGNAVKFTTSGGILLGISRDKPDEDGKGKYLFEVIDTGVGIDADMTGKIFDPFSQGEEGFSKGGTGLGLAICRKHVELMGGKIGLESSVGKGSRFFFRILLPPAFLKSPLSKDINEKREVLGLGDEYNVRVLVVDDDYVNRDVLSKILSSIKIEVIEAKNGVEAVELTRKHVPDLVFMDLRMPVMDGLEAVRRIRKEFDAERVKVAMLTGASAFEIDEKRKEYSEAGCDYLILKPFSTDQVCNCIAELLGVEFEYENEVSKTSGNSKSFDANLSEIIIPNGYYINLKEAAELSQVTRLNVLLAELNAMGGEIAGLSSRLKSFVDRYDMAGILSMLEELRRD